MKEFKVGDKVIYCPGNQVCLLEITKISDYNYDEQCKYIHFKRYTYVGNTYDENIYEIGTALIGCDEGREYIQVDHWLTRKYCIRHIIYCE